MTNEQLEKIEKIKEGCHDIPINMLEAVEQIVVMKNNIYDLLETLESTVRELRHKEMKSYEYLQDWHKERKRAEVLESQLHAANEAGLMVMADNAKLREKLKTTNSGSLT